ncbi:zinc finger protein ZAT1-like [Phragmites australis]|uniref:zinc finger protein ZAT1-like n=1 Tax=Phragmites australis TaxID=29695 RepID=UPI002D792905|nr:zinc finger protein ZAT1-like [Phragmites australis]
MHTPNPTATQLLTTPRLIPASSPLVCLRSRVHQLPRLVSPFLSYMKHPRDAGEVTLSLSLSLGAGGLLERFKKPRRGEGAEDQFVCKTCSRAFASFQALGGHRTSHLRGRHGLALGMLAPAKAATKEEKPAAAASHRCPVCGLGFETGQALGGHMRRHREEATAAAQAPPVLLQLFV